jgi:hypothetical protein
VACSGPQDLDLTVLRERRERAYREARVPVRVRRRCAQGSNSGGAAAGPGRRRCHDDDQEDTASSKTWSALSISSRGRRGRRLEVLTAPACFGRCRILQDKGKIKYVHVRQIKGSPGVSRRDGEITLHRRNRRFTAAALGFSGEESGQPGGAIRRGSRGEMEREAGAFIGAALGRNGRY